MIMIYVLVLHGYPRSLHGLSYLIVSFPHFKVVEVQMIMLFTVLRSLFCPSDHSSVTLLNPSYTIDARIIKSACIYTPMQIDYATYFKCLLF